MSQSMVLITLQMLPSFKRKYPLSTEIPYLQQNQWALYQVLKGPTLYHMYRKMNSIHIASYVVKICVQVLQMVAFPRTLQTFLKNTTEVNITGLWQICQTQLVPGSVYSERGGGGDAKLGNFVLPSTYTVHSSYHEGIRDVPWENLLHELWLTSHYDEKGNRKDTTFPLCVRPSSCSLCTEHMKWKQRREYKHINGTCASLFYEQSVKSTRRCYVAKLKKKKKKKELHLAFKCP
jgi:hypothetical protein